MAASTAFTARDHPQDRAKRLNDLKARVDVAETRTINIDFEGKPAAGQRMLRLRVPRAGTLSGLVGEFDTPATNDSPFHVQVEGVEVATLPANAAKTSGTVTIGAYAAGALVEILAPVAQDPTLSGGIIRLTLSA